MYGGDENAPAYFGEKATSFTFTPEWAFTMRRNTQALKQFAFILQSNIRANDLLARFGSEEFVVILPETDMNKAMELAQILREAISQIRIDVQQDEPISLTTSIGLARYSDDMGSLIQLINHADKALYHATRSGRNQVVAYGMGDI